jgi:hypothetical protein
VAFEVNHLDELKLPEKIAALEEERRSLWMQLTQQKSLEEVYREEESILKTNKSIGGSSKGVPIEELKVAMDYFRQRLMDIKAQLLLADRNIRQYNESIGKIDAQLRELSARKPQPSGKIIVKVSTKSPVTPELYVQYLVNGAQWYPSYDIRAKDIQSPISISYKANVVQHSGEDWSNVKLTISTGKPSQGGARPIIKPWILGFNNVVANASTVGSITEHDKPASTNNFVYGRIVDDQGNGMPGVNVLIKGTTIGTVSDAAGYYSIPLTPDAQTLVCSFLGYSTEEVLLQGKNEVNIYLRSEATMLSEVVVSGVSAPVLRSITGSASGVTTRPRIKTTLVATPVIRQINVEYTLDELFSVKSDGEVYTTEMVEYELDALYEYYCVPKLDVDAFLVAKILDWDRHNFLAGEASLFFEGKYIGKSLIDTRNTSDTLMLSLGRDGNVVVTREKRRDITSRHTVGSNQKATVGYEIAVRNKKMQTLTIVIDDQIPIANDKDITIDKIDDSEAEYNKDTGMLKWRKKIAPGKTELINLQYSVRYPKNSQLIVE